MWVLIPELERLSGGGNATRSSILAWRISCTEEPGGLQSMGRKESDMMEQLNTHTLGCVDKAHIFIPSFVS